MRENVARGYTGRKRAEYAAASQAPNLFYRSVYLSIYLPTYLRRSLRACLRREKKGYRRGRGVAVPWTRPSLGLSLSLSLALTAAAPSSKSRGRQLSGSSNRERPLARMTVARRRPRERLRRETRNVRLSHRGGRSIYARHVHAGGAVPCAELPVTRRAERDTDSAWMPGRRHGKQARRTNPDPTTHVAAITGHRWIFPDDPLVAPGRADPEPGERGTRTAATRARRIRKRLPPPLPPAPLLVDEFAPRNSAREVTRRI